MVSTRTLVAGNERRRRSPQDVSPNASPRGFGGKYRFGFFAFRLKTAVETRIWSAEVFHIYQRHKKTGGQSPKRLCVSYRACKVGPKLGNWVNR